MRATRGGTRMGFGRDSEDENSFCPRQLVYQVLMIVLVIAKIRGRRNPVAIARASLPPRVGGPVRRGALHISFLAGEADNAAPAGGHADDVPSSIDFGGPGVTSAGGRT